MTIPHFDRAAFWKTFRWLSSMGGALAIVWGLSGSVVKPLVAQELLKVLKDNGIDAATIEALGRQGIENGKNIGELSADADKIRGDINTVKQQNQHVIEQQDAMTRQSAKIEELVGKLLDLQLRERALNP